MIYHWANLDNEFKKIPLKLFNIDLTISNGLYYCLNGKNRKGSIGKTVWYIPLQDTETINFGIKINKTCGLKIIKYPVYFDIIDEYYRLLSEYTIQKILYINNLAPNIYKILLVKTNNKLVLEYNWLSEKIIFPKNSIFFAQIVEHVESDDLNNIVNISNDKSLYGKNIELFISKCQQLRISPYDINADNFYNHLGNLKVVDVHKWERTYKIIYSVFPKYVKIELNNVKSKFRKENMSNNILIKILKECNLNNVKYIIPIYTYNDNFVEKDFVQKLKIIKKYAPNTKIIMNTIKEKIFDICYEQCDNAFRSIYILFDGKVCPCCMDFKRKYIFGNIKNSSITEIWNNDKYKNFRRLHEISRIACNLCNKCLLSLKTEEYNNVHDHTSI